MIMKTWKTILQSQNTIKIFVVNGNWYEGHWEKNLKSGFGRYYHMHTGQLQEGCWVEKICVKSMMLDIDVRQYCDRPTQYPIPMVCNFD